MKKLQLRVLSYRVTSSGSLNLTSMFTSQEGRSDTGRQQ